MKDNKSNKKGAIPVPKDSLNPIPIPNQSTTLSPPIPVTDPRVQRSEDMLGPPMELEEFLNGEHSWFVGLAIGEIAKASPWMQPLKYSEDKQLMLSWNEATAIRKRVASFTESKSSDASFHVLQRPFDRVFATHAEERKWLEGAPFHFLGTTDPATWRSELASSVHSLTAMPSDDLRDDPHAYSAWLKERTIRANKIETAMNSLLGYLVERSRFGYYIAERYFEQHTKLTAKYAERLAVVAAGLANQMHTTVRDQASEIATLTKAVETGQKHIAVSRGLAATKLNDWKEAKARERRLEEQLEEESTGKKNAVVERNSLRRQVQLLKDSASQSDSSIAIASLHDIVEKLRGELKEESRKKDEIIAEHATEIGQLKDSNKTLQDEIKRLKKEGADLREFRATACLDTDDILDARHDIMARMLTYEKAALGVRCKNLFKMHPLIDLHV